MVKACGNASRRDSRKYCATLFAIPVQTQDEYAVIEFDAEDKVLRLEDEPVFPKSRMALANLSCTTIRSVRIAGDLMSSSRRLTEITDVNLEYFHQERLRVVRCGRGTAWLDTSTQRSWLEASNY